MAGSLWAEHGPPSSMWSPSLVRSRTRVDPPGGRFPRHGTARREGGVSRGRAAAARRGDAAAPLPVRSPRGAARAGGVRHHAGPPPGERRPTTPGRSRPRRGRRRRAARSRPGAGRPGPGCRWLRSGPRQAARRHPRAGVRSAGCRRGRARARAAAVRRPEPATATRRGAR